MQINPIFKLNAKLGKFDFSRMVATETHEIQGHEVLGSKMMEKGTIQT